MADALNIRHYHYDEELSVSSNTQTKSSIQTTNEHEIDVYDALHKMMYKIPMPKHIPRNLLLRGTKKAQYNLIASKKDYFGCALELLQLLRMMKWYFFINDPLQEWGQIKQAIVKLFIDKGIFSVTSISR